MEDSERQRLQREIEVLELQIADESAEIVKMVLEQKSVREAEAIVEGRRAELETLRRRVAEDNRRG